MDVCFEDFNAPNEVHMFAEHTDNRKIIKVEPFNASVTFNQTESGDHCVWTDYEIWLHLRQGSNNHKIGEADLDTAYLIEDWDGSSNTESLYIERDSSQILDSAYYDDRKTIEPGKAELYLTGRYGDKEFFNKEVDLIADFETIDDVKMDDVRATSPSDSTIELSYDIANPLTVGVEATVRERIINNGTGETIHEEEVVVNPSGVVDYWQEPNVDTFTSTYNLDNTQDMQMRACAEIISKTI